MQYAFMSFSTPKATLDEMLEIAVRYGYDGIEPRIGRDHAHGVEVDADDAQRAAIRKTMAQSDIAMCCIATSCKYADPQDVQQQIEHTRRSIDLASDVNCPRLRVFGGQFDESVSRQDALARIVDALGQLGAHAQRRGVTLCLETHDAWTDPSHVAEIMQRVNHPAVAVNWDVMHPQRVSGWSMDESYQTLKPWVRHVHVHDGVNEPGKLQLLPIGEGDFDHKRVIDLLKADGYDGYISGEWINWKAPEDHLEGELATLRRYEAS